MKLRTLGLTAFMPATMMVSTFTFFALAVAASDLQAEFGVSKLQLGILGALNTGVGAIVAPLAGSFADQVGARTSLATTLFFACIASVVAATSSTFAVLLVASAISGVPQGLGNPATNKAILGGLDLKVRGAAVGIKQSGVQAAVVAAGFAVPLLSPIYGWRSVMWLAAGVSLALVPALLLIEDESRSSIEAVDQNSTKPALSTFVTKVAIFAFLLGLVGGGISRFLPLFAEEAVGLSVTRAGQVFALFGFIAVPSRLLAGVLLDRGFSARTMMAGMAFVGTVALLAVNAASSTQSLIWAGAVLAGLTLGTWNTPANLVVIREKVSAGRATGRLMFGFLLGQSIGGPFLGLLIDRFGYPSAWLASCALTVVAGVMLWIPEPNREPSTT